MRKRQNQVALLLILAVTAFSIVVTWPGSPDRYLPNFIPWPSGGGISIGDFERKDFRLGLDLAGGVSVTLEATGESVRVRAGESAEEFAERTDVTVGALLDLNPALADLTAAERARPLPVSFERLTLPLSQTGADFEEGIEQARGIMEQRVSGFGVSEAEVIILGSDRINVQIPGVTASEAAGLVGSVALLEFREIDPRQPTQPLPLDPLTVQATLEDAFDPLRLVPPDPDQLLPLTPPRLIEYPVLDPDQDVIVVAGQRWIPATGRDADGAEVQLVGEFLEADSVQITFSSGLPAIAFRFDAEGGDIFEEITSRLAPTNSPLGIFVDGQLVSAPRVQAVISRSGVITGLTAEVAQILRRQLRAGALPLNFSVIQQTEVAATLGDDSVVDTVQAGLVGFLAIIVFMILYYRLPGVLAALALMVYVAAVMATFKLVPVTLTLAGIAGFVLSLGLAVDANILIFERMREELRLGRGLQAAIDTGFNRAWPAIRDANVSTLIIVAILYIFGDQFNASLIKSFAVTLFIGTLFSMATAIFVTRTFLNLVVGFGLGRKPWLFGIHRIAEEASTAPDGRRRRQPAPGARGGD